MGDGGFSSFSALAVFSFRSFSALSRRSRHNLVATVLQHSAAMRFGHFVARVYSRTHFVWSASQQAFSLTTDWHRYSGVHRYCLRFPVRPTRRELLYYVRDGDGKTLKVLSAATVLFWHFSMLRSTGELTVVAPVQDGVPPVRSDRQLWLRSVLFAALPVSESAARALVPAVTPHSFRPGMAGDMLRAGASMASIMRWCRWWSERVARMYAQRPALSDARSSRDFRRVSEVGDSFAPLPTERTL